MDALRLTLQGAVSMASLVAALFFLRFWIRTRDVFFLLFAAAFAVETASRFILGSVQVSDESEPYYYLPRLVGFSLILLAVVLKNAERR